MSTPTARNMRQIVYTVDRLVGGLYVYEMRI